MARPPKEKKEKRSFRYTFRMNEDELEFLEKLSDYSDLPTADVDRVVVRNPEGAEPQRYAWKEGSMIVPPRMER